MSADKPAVPTGIDPWERIPVDTSDQSPFAQVLRFGVSAADDWIFSARGPYQNPAMTGADKTRNSVREALLHLLELGFIDIDTDRLEAALFVPTSREVAGA